MASTEEVTTRLTDLDITLAERARAIRVVAGIAEDAEDCGMLLDVLGLTPQDAYEPSPE